MCGTYRISTEEDNIYYRRVIENASRQMFDKNKKRICESGDVYPGDTAPIIYTDSSIMTFDCMRWGFDLNGKKIINARSETVLERPLFRESARSMRCIVPAIGYYEWNSKKEKFFFTDPNGEELAIAGLYRYAADGAREFAIITCEAYDAYGDIHPRMPLIIRERELWLNSFAESRKLLAAGNNVKLNIQCQSPRQISMF